MLLGLYVEQVRLLMQQIMALSALITESMKEHAAEIVRMCRLPGIDTYAAQDLLAEIGPGAEQFDSPQQLASWAGVCPGRQESAGVNYSSRSARGNRFLRRIICQIGWAAARTKRTFISTLFQRWSPRLGPKSAAWAISHRMLKFVWHVLHQKMEYRERGPVQPDPRSLSRKFRRIANQLRAAGLDPVTLLPMNAV
jgi:transposase